MLTPETALAQAWQHHQSGNTAQAEALYRQVLDLDPRHVEALYLLGALCQLLGRTAESIAFYQQCLKVKPDYAQVHNNLGVIHAAQGRLDEALACYREALRHRPDVAEMHTNLGHVFTKLGRRQEAAAAYAEARRLNPGTPQMRVDMAIASVPATFAETQPGRGTAEALNDQAVVLMGQGRDDEALTLLQEAATLKELPEVHNNLGLLHAASGDYAQAVAAYRRALALKPESPETWNNLGTVCFQDHQPDEAVRCFREALTRKPNDPDVLLNLGNVLLFQERPAEACTFFRLALRLRPDSSALLNNLALALTRLQKWDEAADAWQRSLTLNGSDPQTHRNLGRLFYNQGKFEKALPWYERLLAISPADADARLMIEALRRSTHVPRVPADYVAGLYDGLAADFDLDPRAHSPEQLKAALAPAPAARSLDILDLGCGTGMCGVQFRDWAKTLVGVDLSPKMLDKARARRLYDALIESDLLTPLQAAEGKYDLVLASDSLIFLGDLGPVFQAVRRALRPGGRFAFTVELLEGTGYRMVPAVHFSHSRAYLRELSTKHHMREICMKQMFFRREGDQDIAGLLVVLDEPTARRS
jgi:predicted TPR repeat methyltransferase